MEETASLVTVSAYGAAGSSARVRLFDWLSHLDIEAERHTYLGRAANPLGALARTPLTTLRAERDLRRLSRSVSDSTVLLSREASPLSFGTIEARLLRRARRGVYDYDDALFAGYPGGLLSRARGIDRVWRRAVDAADIVIAGSDTLAEPASERGREVVVIPSCVEPDGYPAKLDYEVADTPRAVWLGSPSTEHYLLGVVDPLLALHRDLGLRLTVISAGQRELGALDSMVDRIEWTPEGAVGALTDADVGIMPLPDDEWTRGKCAYKLLQYAAAGLPVVGSAVGANVPVLKQLGGIAVTTADEWREALTAILRASTSERERLGRRARTEVTAHYSYAAWTPAWRAATGV